MMSTERDAIQAYEDMLDECYGTVEIAGFTFDTARALRELDPIAYRCGFNDWCDAEGINLDELVA